MAEKKTAETAAVKKEDKEERVPYFIPYIDGEAPDETVGLNGKMYKIQKGVKVMVPKGVASILDHANTQNMVAAKNREKLQKQNNQ